ncbi:MbtH family NRPS accessory protein [Mycobacterium kansasii]|uniref:MbtH-like family protein n=2 Tax=Mycobacterium kansasii TaxID=1768 RepID=A0A1V3X8N4_MYCKA|nr:MbtH family NRPS accessory protein [Mycobacterium kansasii]ETZ97881.1 mbtH-like family protein [Mycobacterium kansasii 824]OOK75116.1 mbtH-like family protein [Mycobacterium kansasii]UCA21300.1 MbtH family protein [Mycobacterium kansasii]UGT81350.1 MbtH family protein [Mycobacterium kansasii]UGT85625.1 MbtH family protein [Mycobacterium kansasii]
MRRRHQARGNNVSVNPFDNEGATLSAFVNDEKQYGLWSTFVDVASSWRGSLRSGFSRCTPEYLYKNWTNIRPKALRERLAQHRRTAGQ